MIDLRVDDYEDVLDLDVGDEFTDAQGRVCVIDSKIDGKAIGATVKHE